MGSQSLTTATGTGSRRRSFEREIARQRKRCHIVREFKKNRQGANVSRQLVPAFDGVKGAIQNLSRNVSRDLCCIPDPFLFNSLVGRRSYAKLRAGFIESFPNVPRSGAL